MSLDYRHGVFVLELVVYIPAFGFAIWLAFRHGFGKTSGWMYFAILCILKIIGSICYLITTKRSDSNNLYITWAVCNSIGLSPLLTACMGLLSRVNNSIRRQGGASLPERIFTIAGLITVVALILSIVGMTQGNNLMKGTINSKTKVGTLLFLAAWFALCVLLWLVSMRRRDIEDGEGRLLVAVVISALLLLVRIIYSILGAFVHNSDFNILSGNVTIELVMSILEEILVVLTCLGVGVTLPILRKGNGSRPQSGDSLVMHQRSEQRTGIHHQYESQHVR